MAQHPHHPILVHFPIACCTLAALLDTARLLHLIPGAAALAAPGLDDAALSYTLLALGVASGLPAMVVGFVDFLELPPALQQASALTWHVAAMSTAWGLFLGAALLRAKAGVAAPLPSGALALELSGSASLAVGGRLAASVVYARWPPVAPYTDDRS